MRFQSNTAECSPFIQKKIDWCSNWDLPFLQQRGEKLNEDIVTKQETTRTNMVSFPPSLKQKIFLSFKIKIPVHVKFWPLMTFDFFEYASSTSSGTRWSAVKSRAPTPGGMTTWILCWNQFLYIFKYLQKLEGNKIRNVRQEILWVVKT